VRKKVQELSGLAQHAVSQNVAGWITKIYAGEPRGNFGRAGTVRPARAGPSVAPRGVGADTAREPRGNQARELRSARDRTRGTQCARERAGPARDSTRGTESTRDPTRRTESVREPRGTSARDQLRAVTARERAEPRGICPGTRGTAREGIVRENICAGTADPPPTLRRVSRMRKESPRRG
jgi:hypothetical protein